MSVWSCQTYLAIVASVVLGLVSCQSNSTSTNQQNNYADIVKQHNIQQITPWPELGRRPGRINSSSNYETQFPTWIRPTTSSQVSSWILPTSKWNEKPYRTNQNSAGSHFNNPDTNSNHRNYATNNNYNNNNDNSVHVTDNELREFGEKLLTKDENNAARYVTIHYQGQTTSRSKLDQAPELLLSIQRDAYKIPTIDKLMKLYDNYVVRSNVAEDNTLQERNEENDFLDAVLATSVMKYAQNFLIEKGRISTNAGEFKELLHQIWFGMFARGGGKVGSSGFEHVFLGEIARGKVSGLHNWIYFNNEEENGRANYLGYMRKVDLGDKGAILKYNFDFLNINKPVGSMFIGTSPEFEMAVFSTCYLLRADKVCPINLKGHRVTIRTYSYTFHGKKTISSAFTEM